MVTSKHTDAKHPYHLVDPSPWPLLTSLAALVMMVGYVLLVNAYASGKIVLIFGVGGLLVCIAGWLRDVVHEATTQKMHNKVVQMGIKIGFMLFILSELMFFVGFFWAYFDASLFPAEVIGGVWPPKGIETIDPFRLPYLNTLLLLLSATSLTWAHEAMVKYNDMADVKKGLLITIGLGLLFTCIQVFEYVHAPFTLKDGIYGSNFYMLTGFHGVHVLIGTIFLVVCYFRSKRNHFTQEQHVGFETSAWYWHFVDVVWLFLFVFVYWWAR